MDGHCEEEESREDGLGTRVVRGQIILESGHDMRTRRRLSLCGEGINLGKV